MKEREGCCADWPKPCSYHEGYADASDKWEAMHREMEAIARTNYEDKAHPIQVENSRLLKMVEKVRFYLEQKPVDVSGIRMAVNGVQTEVSKTQSCPVCGTHTGTHWYDYCPRWDPKTETWRR